MLFQVCGRATVSSPLIREDEAKRAQGGLRVFQKIRGDFALGGIKVIRVD